MSLRDIALRLAASSLRKSVLTTRGRVDSSAPGPARSRRTEELVEHLEQDKENAVLVWTGRSWAAVMRDRSSPSSFAVFKLPTDEVENKVGDKIKSAKEAVETALQLSGSDRPRESEV